MRYKTTTTKASSLGALPSNISQMISENQDHISQVLNRANRLNGLGRLQKKASNMLSADEVIKRYNAGISEDEIKAWVWYRRSIGVPMTGWEKFFIDKSTGVQEEMLYTSSNTTVKDTAWRDIKVLPKGILLGKRIGRKQHKSNDLETYIFYRDNDGIKLVRKDHVKLSKSTMKTDHKELERLVKVSALYYLNGELLPYPVYSYANMYDRELDLRNDQEQIISQYGEKVYQQHLKLIKDNRPKPLSILNPDENERQQILAISEYARSFKISGLKAETGAVLNEEKSLVAAYKVYLRTLDRTNLKM